MFNDIFVAFSKKIQIVSIPVGINYSPHLANIFLYSYEGNSQSFVSMGEKLASWFMHRYKYIDYVFSIINQEFEKLPGPDISC